MMEFTKNKWGQRDITNKTEILTKQSSDTIYDVIPTKYQKYYTTTIPKNALSKVNKSTYGSLLNTPSHDAYSIPIHVRTMTLEDINHEQKEYNPNNSTNWRVSKINP